jgi:hypothetical protein
MEDTIQAQVEIYRVRLNALIRRGLEVRDDLLAQPATPTSDMRARMWRQDCGVAINELSGGSKAHWLARAFSDAFLVRGSAEAVVEEVAPSEIVRRLIDVLEQALASLSEANLQKVATSQAPAPHRFDFVHDAEIRPILEQAYGDGQRALDGGDYGLALLSYSGILEAIVTDALQHKGITKLHVEKAPARTISDWPFETRLSIAENSGLIGRGCARLPMVARQYRDLQAVNRKEAAALGVSERDARLTSQVLHVVMRDLNPGR